MASLTQILVRPSVRPAYKWWVVAMLWLVCFFNYADRQSIPAIFPALEREFGFSKEQLGLIGSAFMWVYAGCALLAGLAGDRWRRKDLILGGCAFWSVVTMATGWCSRLVQFVTVRAMEGFGEAFYFPAGMALIGDYHGPRTRSRAMAFHQSGVYVGTVVGSWLGGWIAMRFGWRAGFYFFGAAGIILAGALYVFLREPARGQAETADAVAEDAGSERRQTVERLGVGQTFAVIFRSPAVVLLMLAFVGANAVAAVFLVWTPSFLTDKFHYDLATAGLNGTAFIHLASALSVPAAGVAADRLSRRIAGGRILVQAAGLLGGAAFIVLVALTTRRSTLVASMTCFGLCKGLYDSGIFASLYDSIEPRARATAAGIMNTAGWAGGAAGPLLVGWIADHGRAPTKIANMSHAIAWGGAIYVLAAMLLVAAALLAGENR